MPSDNRFVMEFAHILPVNVRSLPRRGKEITLISDARQCAKLAQNHALVAVEHFNVHFHLVPQSGGRVRLDGTFSARVVQNCVISGEALTREVKDDFSLIFVPQTEGMKSQVEIILDGADEEDITEFFDGTYIDLGAVVEEFFELALDPYPRKEGVEFHSIQVAEKEAEDEPISPFAVLKKIHL